MKKLLVILVVLVASVSMLIGCAEPAPAPTPAPTPTPKPAPTPAGAPKYGGTLRMGDVSMPPGSIGWPADPLFSMTGVALPAMIESLVDLDKAGVMLPKLATNWDIASDLKSVTMTLRQGVKFHDGSDFNAAVAKWNIETMIAAHATSLAAFVSVDVIDDYTIRINLTNYTNTVPTGLSSTFMVSKAAFDKNGMEWMRMNPVGTGPFKFVSYEPTVSIKTTKFEGYWQKGKPYLDAVEIIFIADPMTRAAAFEADEVDIISSDPTKTEYDLQQKGYPVLSTFPGIFCMVPDTRNADSPLKDIKVRQAVEYAIDREDIAKLGYGFWAPVYQYSIPDTPSYIKDLPARLHDPEKAKKLLAEAGVEGLNINLYGSQMVDNDVFVAIQDYLAKVGITAEVVVADAGMYREFQMKGWENGFVCGPFSCDLNLNISLNFIWTTNSPFVAGMQKTDELDNIYNAASATKDLEPELIQKAPQYIFDTVMFIPVYLTSRGSVLKPFVRDTGLYTYFQFMNWDPASAWLDK